MSDLESFLERESEDGVFQGTGAFAVDFAKAGERRAKFALPKPELWIIRLLQGLTRLGATDVELRQSRRHLTVEACLAMPLSDNLSLQDLFRVASSQDPRAPLLDGVWGALGKGFRVTLEWPEKQGQLKLEISQKEVVVGKPASEPESPTLRVQVEPQSKVSLLAKMCGVTSYAKEFFEVSQGAILAPYSLTLDGRSCDLSTGFERAYFPSQEFRAQRALGGPCLPPVLDERVRHPALTDQSMTPMEGAQGYAFMLALRWDESSLHAPTVHWIQDGFVCDQEPLLDIRSPLRVVLFLPAEGLSNDLTGLHLRESVARRRRLAESRLWALAALKTLPPQLTSEVSDASLYLEVERLYTAALKAESKRFKKTASFVNEPKAHRTRRATQKAALQRWHQTRGTTVTETVLRREGIPEEQQEAVERWGRFLSYVPRQTVHFKEIARGDAPKVEDFFGDVYVRVSPSDRGSA